MNQIVSRLNFGFMFDSDFVCTVYHEDFDAQTCVGRSMIRTINYFSFELLILFEREIYELISYMHCIIITNLREIGFFRETPTATHRFLVIDSSRIQTTVLPNSVLTSTL